MSSLEIWEFLSYIVTVIGLPFAIVAYLNMLISLFERAYLVLYEASMSAKEARRWRSWEDYMREWCARPDFRNALPELLRGEDPEFVAYIQELALAAAPRS